MKSPLFIIGCPRSGTTLLASLLMNSNYGALEYSRSDIEWMMPGSPGGLGWNIVGIGGNAYNFFLDTWNYVKTYNIGDTVVYNADTWQAIQGSNYNKPPKSNPSYWTKIANYSGGGEQLYAIDDLVISSNYI